jgi:hypothetical protein
MKICPILESEAKFKPHLIRLKVGKFWTLRDRWPSDKGRGVNEQGCFVAVHDLIPSMARP